MKPLPLASAASPVSAQSPVRYFIADLHLDGLDTPRAKHFRDFLKRLSNEAAARPIELYIVGDLFEFWYEYRAALFEIYRADLSALDAASKAGVKIFLFYGNRDFAYGRYVQRRFNATILGDGEGITLNDSRPLWLEHGDLLCTADTRYLRFRSIIRSFPVKVLFWLMPWSFARRTIERIRSRTQADKSSKPKSVVAIDLQAARRRLEANGCKVLICGHTHQPISEDLGAGYRLIVLPPWCDAPAGYVDDGALKPFSLALGS
ncbi:MAG TPA: UDP-2,3-diacylglucosamine diphosphatase [Planctomycetota bacterium]|nr:UDP-2,3-diacylglucosamine diphosphatase [Planctomycetota bacterium]